MENFTLENAVYLPVGEIQRPKRNPNKMTEFMFHSLVEGIRKRGDCLVPIIIRKEDKRIIDGDHRYIASIEAGLTSVPVVVLDITEEEAVKFGIELNQKKGYFDYLELRDILTDYKTEDMSALSLELGFTEIELQRLLEDSSFDSEKLIKQKLLEAGVSTDKIDAMADVAKSGEYQEIPDVDIQGQQSKIRFPIVFFCESEEDLNLLKGYFQQEGNKEPNTSLLVALVKEKLNAGT